MAIQDIHIDRAWQRQFLPVSNFLLLNSTTLKAGYANDGSTPLAYGALSTFGIPAITMSADNDHVRVVWVPPSLDLTAKVYFRVHWSSGSSTAADDSVWALTFKEKTPQTNAIAFSSMTATTPATVTDTVGVATAYLHNRTDAVYIPANTLTLGQVVELNLNVNSASAATVYFRGLEILYMPRLAQGISRSLPAIPSDWTVAS